MLNPFHDHGGAVESLYRPQSIPLIVVALVSAFLGTSFVKGRLPSSSLLKPSEDGDEDDGAVDPALSLDIHWDGYTFFTLLRILIAFGLLGLSIAHATQELSLVHRPFSIWSIVLQCPELSYTTCYLAGSVLLTTSLLSRRWRKSTIRGANAILFSVFGVYAYRDLWPLATYHLRPADLALGSILWVKIALLFWVAVVTPLVIPRSYVPIDPKNPMEEMNPEATASILSLAFFFFLDPLLLKANKQSHLPYAQFPPLMDTDRSSYLTGRAFKYLDQSVPSKRSPLIIGLLRTFKKEYIAMATFCVLQVVATFASPIGMNRILDYLQTDGVNATVRPWFWIICMMVGPLARSLCAHAYTFLSSGTVIRAQAILTQLVFEHSLKIRVKAEVSTPSSISNVAEQDEERSASDVDEHDGDADSESGSMASESTVLANKNNGDKATVESPSPPELEKQPEPVNKTKNLVGKINNLISTDVAAITNSKDILILVVTTPFQILLSVAFLYVILGWSAFIVFVAIAALGPIPGYIVSRMTKYERTKMEKSDARVQDVSEAIGVLRMIKLFGWERHIAGRIQHKRDEEIEWIKKSKILEWVVGMTQHIIPLITTLIAYASYTLIFKHELTAAKIFSSLSVFDILRQQLLYATREVPIQIEGKVAVERLQAYLRETELLDAYTPTDDHSGQLETLDSVDDRIGFGNIDFSWSRESGGPVAPYRLRIRDEVVFKPGGINMIVGPTGSGKTSILMALLGEMHAQRKGSTSWVNLPRAGGVAYAAQESWVQNATIRENIVFGSTFDEDRYRKVLHQCALNPDLELFEAGDATEVGEKGLTLSGGQKARVTLARAIYSDAQILLLDDILAALDVHTATWIVRKCLLGDLVRGRTVLLVTHNVSLVGPLAHKIIRIRSNGVVTSEDQEVDLSGFDDHSPDDVNEGQGSSKPGDSQLNNASDSGPATGKGKLVLAEEIKHGHVTWRSINLLISAMGGDYPALFFAVMMLGFLLMAANNAVQVWFLGFWAEQYETHPASEVSAPYYLSIASLLIVAAVVWYGVGWGCYIIGSLRGSRKIHTLLIDSILSSTLRWLDETPTGRIISRCTQDISAVDEMIPSYFFALFELFCEFLSKFMAVVIFTPVFLIPGVGIAVLGVFLGNFYLRAQLSARREMSNGRSPVMAHLGATLSGLISVRAYGVEETFKRESLRRINHYTRAARVSWDLNRWIGVRMDILGSLFITSLATYLVYGPRRVGASNTGFSLTMALEFTTQILYCVRVYNIVEVQSNSLERIQSYLDIEHEPKATESGKPPASWPTSGDLRVENLSARYSQMGPKVLHDISFHIKTGERIGVVGRTGSGKSSLTLALLRAIVTEGSVYFDGRRTNKTNLDALRSSITIIPQAPELLSGTLRRNLDPFGEHDDAVLNDALRSSGLFALQQDLNEGRLTLDSEIAGGGSNLSVGQRQVLALARAMVRQSKLLILDEATSAIDYKTDSIIQQSLRTQLGPDVTMITVAHRLQTIMDSDKIMVLDAGKIVEFDSPYNLLRKEGSFFKALVDESRDKDTLHVSN